MKVIEHPAPVSDTCRTNDCTDAGHSLFRSVAIHFESSAQHSVGDLVFVNGWRVVVVVRSNLTMPPSVMMLMARKSWYFILPAMLALFAGSFAPVAMW